VTILPVAARELIGYLRFEANHHELEETLNGQNVAVRSLDAAGFWPVIPSSSPSNLQVVYTLTAYLVELVDACLTQAAL